MNKAEIEREIHRLAPWYFDLDVGGVRTSIAPACDKYGHRPLLFPAIREGYWAGKTVLDVGCNEGAWSFGVLDQGAARVDAFDCRQDNVDKARFVASVRGVERATFHVASTDSWIAEHGGQTFDKILLCGILYHLPTPWTTIAQYCAIAEESIFVSCVLRGGDEDGYTRYSELDNVAASDESLDSLMPHTMNTLLAEFAKHGFRPTHVQETGEGRFGGGCYLLLERCTQLPRFDVEHDVRAGEDLDIYLTPVAVEDAAGRDQPFDVQVVLFNRAHQARSLHGVLRAIDVDGTELHRVGPLPIDFPARVQTREDTWSLSHDHRAELDLGGARLPVTVEVELRDPDDGTLFAVNRATIRG